MQNAKHSKDPHKLSELLRSMLNRHFANINDPHLYRFPAVGTKSQIETLLNKIESAILTLIETEWGEAFDAQAKKEFVYSAQHIVGQSALCLSGGGSLAMFHFGMLAEL